MRQTTQAIRHEPAAGVCLSRGVVLAILFFLFAGEYVFTTYWKLARPAWEQMLLAGLTAAVGVAWAFFASGPLEVRFSAKGFVWFLAALAILGAMNLRPLLADLTWRGDEDHHFKATLMLAAVIKSDWPILLILLVPLAAAVILQAAGLSGAKALWAVAATAALSAVAVIVGIEWSKPPFDMYFVGHYPLATNWLAVPAVAIARAFSSGANPPEASFRVVPFLSVALLAWVCASKAKGLNGLGRVLYILAIGSVPLVLYYSAILYLEMPAILLMTVACLDADGLLTCEPRDIVRRPAWHALILCGFIKDSIPPLLAAAILSRMWVRLRPAIRAGHWLRPFMRECVVAACVAAPYMTFWVYRTFYSRPERVYSPNPAWLVSADAWGTVLWALLEQFGPAAIAFAAVLLVLPGARRTPTRLLLAMMFGFWAAAHIMDRCTSTTNVSNGTGFSRYMLLATPMVIVGLHEAVRYVASRRTLAAAVGLSAVIGINLLLAPIHWDGSREPGWGEYRYNFAEHSYPYRSAIRYIQANYPSDRTLITGLDYQYWHEFYTGGTDRFARAASSDFSSKKDEPLTARQMLAYANDRGFQHVLYHVMNASLPRLPETCGFVQQMVFKNSSHELVFFSRRPDGAGGH
jgi:hypothetical protein